MVSQKVSNRLQNITGNESCEVQIRRYVLRTKYNVILAMVNLGEFDEYSPSDLRTRAFLTTHPKTTSRRCLPILTLTLTLTTHPKTTSRRCLPICSRVQRQSMARGRSSPYGSATVTIVRRTSARLDTFPRSLFAFSMNSACCQYSFPRAVGCASDEYEYHSSELLILICHA